MGKENDQLEGPWLRLVLRPNKGIRDREIMQRRCIKRALDPNTGKHMCWENVEQTTN